VPRRLPRGEDRMRHLRRLACDHVLYSILSIRHRLVITWRPGMLTD
jgi:hypothetical protein